MEEREREEKILGTCGCREIREYAQDGGLTWASPRIEVGEWGFFNSQNEVECAQCGRIEGW
jgi:hypothetical protein